MKKLYTLLIALLLSGIVSGQFSNKELFDVYSTDSLNAWIVGAEGTIFHTEDGGISWMDHSIDTTLDLLSIDFSDENNGFIVGDSGLVLRTTNGGNIWNIMELGADGILSKVEFVDDIHGWIFSHGDFSLLADTSLFGIYRTTDGGNNWNFIEYLIRDFCMIDSLTGYGILLGTPPYPISGVIAKTIDGGLNWFQISNIGIIGAFKSIWFADSLNGLLGKVGMGWPSYDKSIDGGVTWTNVSGDDMPSSVCFSTVNNLWMGISGGIEYSYDFCQTFNNCYLGTYPYDNFASAISAYGPDNGWAVGRNFYNSNGYVWKLLGINDWVEVLPVNIEEGKSDHLSFFVYPNPSSSTITIELPTQQSQNTTLTLSNTNGQQLIIQPITAPQTEIDISHLPVGIYIVKVWNDKDVMVQKVIKQ